MLKRLLYFRPRVLVPHDGSGQSKMSQAERAALDEICSQTRGADGIPLEKYETG